MQKKEIIWQSKVNADILSESFYEQLGLENADLPPTEQPFYYDLDVEVSLLNAGMSERIQQFSFKTSYYSKTNDLKDRFSNILNEQISTVRDIFKDLGYQFANISICAEPLENPTDVTITFSRGKDKEYDNKGRLKSIFTVTSIIPCGPGFRAQIQQLVLDGCLALEREYQQKFLASLETPVPTVPLKQLLTTIASVITSVTDIHENAQALTASWLEDCRIQKKKPLSIEGRLGRSEASTPETVEVACPPWLLYTEKTNGIWYIDGFESGAGLQYELAETWKRKTTRIAVPLHDLKPLRYSLLARKANGIAMVSVEEAKNYSSVQVMWDEPVD